MLNESYMSCPEWSRLQRNIESGRTVRRCLMKTFGHGRTLVSGQAVAL